MPGFNRIVSRNLTQRLALAKTLLADAKAHPELTVAELAHQHGVSRASAYRIIAELPRDPLCE